MSKLVEKLKSLKREAAPMGFRPAEPAGRRPSLLIIGCSSAPPADSSTLLTGATGALDAVFVPGKGLTGETLKRLSKSASGLPVGFSIEGTDTAGFAGLAGAGADFIVFDLTAAATVLETKNLGKFLELAGDAEAARVMTAAELAPVIDGVVLTITAGAAVILEYLLACRRAVRLFGIPVLAEVPASITADELKCLWEAGVDGVVTGDIAAAAGIRKAVESLPGGSRRLWGSRPRPILPRPGEGTPSDEEEEE